LHFLPRTPAKLTIGGRAATPLWIRLPTQLFWIGALVFTRLHWPLARVSLAR